MKMINPRTGLLNKVKWRPHQTRSHHSITLNIYSNIPDILELKVQCPFHNRALQILLKPPNMHGDMHNKILPLIC